MRAVLIVAVSVACTLWHVRLRPVDRSPIEHVAWSCALLSVGWALAAAIVGSRAMRRVAVTAGTVSILPLARLAAVLFGVVSGVILAVLLAMRCALIVAELINGEPGISGFDGSFTSDGLWSLACLWVGCVVSMLATRDARLATCAFLVGSMGLTWACLLSPVFVLNTQSHSYGRSLTLLVLIVLQSLWLSLTAYLADRVDRRNEAEPSGVDLEQFQSLCSSRRIVESRRNLGQPRELKLAARYTKTDSAPAVTRSALPPMAVELGSRRGLRSCCDVLAVVIALAICYHIAVPQRAFVAGLDVSGIACLFAAVLVSTACFRWLRRSWSVFTAEAGLGHMSLAACSGATLATSGHGLSMQEHYPATFAAMMVGFCLAAGVCAWLAIRGDRLRATDHGRTTLLARLAPYARRFAFVDVALAFLVGVVMMMWPRLPTVATMDDSLGRVTSGLGANLLLLLVVLWCGRRLRQPAFHVLTVLAMLLVGGFLLVRILPFSSHIG